MGQKDLAQNDYFNDKTRFADVCNGILFQGENRIKPEDLQEADTDIVYREDKGKLRKIVPDKVRLWKGTYLSIITLENQSVVDYHMVFRAMKEEAVSYEKQWKKLEQEYLKGDSLLKGRPFCFCKTEDKFIPVITIVIYMGNDKAWDGATCLYDMLDISEELYPYITNYKMNLFDYHDCEDFSIFKTENRELFELLSKANDEKAMNDTISENSKRYSDLDAETTELICDIAGIDKDIIKKQVKKTESEEEQEVVNMCKAWDDHKEIGRQEGIKEGILETSIKDIQNIMSKLKLTATQAMDILDIAESERGKYMQLIK